MQNRYNVVYQVSTPSVHAGLLAVLVNEPEVKSGAVKLVPMPMLIEPVETQEKGHLPSLMACLHGLSFETEDRKLIEKFDALSAAFSPNIKKIGEEAGPALVSFQGIAMQNIETILKNIPTAGNLDRTGFNVVFLSEAKMEKDKIVQAFDGVRASFNDAPDTGYDLVVGAAGYTDFDRNKSAYQTGLVYGALLSFAANADKKTPFVKACIEALNGIYPEAREEYSGKGAVKDALAARNELMIRAIEQHQTSMN